MKISCIYKFLDKGSAKECFCDILDQTSNVGVEYDAIHNQILIYEDCFMVDHAIRICENHGGNLIINNDF